MNSTSVDLAQPDKETLRPKSLPERDVRQGSHYRPDDAYDEWAKAIDDDAGEFDEDDEGSSGLDDEDCGSSSSDCEDDQEEN